MGLANTSPAKTEGDCCGSETADIDQPGVQVATPANSKAASPQPHLHIQLPLPDLAPVAELAGVTGVTASGQSGKPGSESIDDRRQSRLEEPKVFLSHLDAPFENSQKPALSPISPGTMINNFIATTSFNPCDEYVVHHSDISDQSSPKFMMDWGQFNLAQMNGMYRPDLMVPMGLGMDGMMETSMLAMMPDFTPQINELQTPLTTPRLSFCGSSSDVDMGHSSITLSDSSRQGSVNGDFGYMDLAAVIQGQDGWNCFRSGPIVPSSQVPKTARLHIERLEQSLQNQESWNSWRPAWHNTDPSNDHLAVMPVQDCSQGRLNAITQSVLQKAMQTHGQSQTSSNIGLNSFYCASNFILLPPPRVLEHFLRSYANTFERYLPMSPCGTLDVNQSIMAAGADDRAGGLLTLMMIAAGALSIPSMDARWVNGGLVEACRLSLLDVVETDISMASNTTVSHAALLLTTTAAWSGDKWHMNIAMGQRGMYTAMLRHSGALDSQAMTLPASSAPEQLHADWQRKETTSRLVYSWAMLDQDLSLFHDAAPLFSIVEFNTPLPDSDRLWHAKTTAEWSTVFSQVHEFSGGFSAAASGVRPVSLSALFRHFMEDDIIPRGMDLTPLHLRLLLHPLQALVLQYRQLTSCFSDNIAPRQQASNVHTQSVRARGEELQVLLKRWRRLADRYASAHPLCPLMQASMVFFHLISLNTVTSLPEIEKLARKEDFDGSYGQMMWKLKRCVTDVEEAVYHCGQIVRLIKGMPSNVRPPWWPGAVYRVGLIMWAQSLMHSEEQTSARLNAHGDAAFSPLDQQYIGIDSFTAEHPVISRYRTKKEGRPALTRRDGSPVPAENGFAILSHCLEIIDEGVANRFSDGIRNKIEKLARGL